MDTTPMSSTRECPILTYRSTLHDTACGSANVGRTSDAQLAGARRKRPNRADTFPITDLRRSARLAITSGAAGVFHDWIFAKMREMR
jgi:hypothetical protein